MKRFLTLLIVLISFSVSANEFAFTDGVINIPSEFDGPMTKELGPGAHSIAFQKLHKNGKATLLQISVLDPGKPFLDMTDEQHQIAATHYLEFFLKGVERKRENFEKSEIELIEISAVPAAKISWKGDIDSNKAHGVMYCYIFNSKIFSLHTQDLVEYEGLFTDMAEKAFEEIAFVEGDDD